MPCQIFMCSDVLLKSGRTECMSRCMPQRLVTTALTSSPMLRYQHPGLAKQSFLQQHRQLKCQAISYPDAKGKNIPEAMSVEIEPRFYGLRNISEKEGAFEADFGLKVRWGPVDSEHNAKGPPPPPPTFYITEFLDTTELERRAPSPLPHRGPRWSEMSVRTRSTSIARFELQDFPYDVHKLRVVVRIPSVQSEGIQSITAIQESKPTPRLPDLGLQDWLVLRQRCYMRTVLPGNKWFLRRDAPTETSNWGDDGGVSSSSQEQKYKTDTSKPPYAANNRRKRHSTTWAAPGDAPTGAPKAPRQTGLSPTKTSRLQEVNTARLEFVMEFLVQRRATFWWTSVYLPLVAMELIVPLAFAMPVQDLSNRLVLIVTLVLAPAVFKSALAERLPSVGYLTTLDKQFLFAYVFILASTMVHAGLHNLIDLGVALDVVQNLNVIGAVVSMIVLAGYHIRHYLEYYMPYNKRLSMFEKRSFYAPPVVSTMDTWKAVAAPEERPPWSPILEKEAAS